MTTQKKTPAVAAPVVSTAAEIAAHLTDAQRLHVMQDAARRLGRGECVITHYKSGLRLTDVLTSFRADRSFDIETSTLLGSTMTHTRAGLASMIMGRAGLEDEHAKPTMNLDQVIALETAQLRERQHHRLEAALALQQNAA